MWHKSKLALSFVCHANLSVIVGNRTKTTLLRHNEDLHQYTTSRTTWILYYRTPIWIT